MFCNECGKELPDDARFCSKCGNDLSKLEERHSQAVVTEPVAKAGPSGELGETSGSGTGADGAKGPSPKRKRTVAIISVAAVVVVALVAVGVVYFMQQQKYEREHRTSLVTLAFTLPEYGEGEGSGVPVKVEGVDLDGNNVSEKLVAPATGYEVELKRGDYRVSIVGSPVTESGRIYEFPQDAAEVSIGENGPSVSGGASSPSFEFRSIAPENVTDDQIAAIRGWMGEFGIGKDKVETMGSAVTEARRVEQERIAEEQRKAEEEARRKAEEEERKRREALTSEVFSTQSSFMFTSGAGGWMTNMTVNPDGTFTGAWEDHDLGVTGPGYPKGTLMREPFEGKFTVLEKASDTDYVMQIDYLHATEPEGKEIKDGQMVETHAGPVHGLGPLTDAPVGGWHFYRAGQSASAISEAALTWLYKDTYERGGATLKKPAICNAEFGWAVSSR